MHDRYSSNHVKPSNQIAAADGEPAYYFTFT